MDVNYNQELTHYGNATGYLGTIMGERDGRADGITHTWCYTPLHTTVPGPAPLFIILIVSLLSLLPMVMDPKVMMYLARHAAKITIGRGRRRRQDIVIVRYKTASTIGIDVRYNTTEPRRRELSFWSA